MKKVENIFISILILTLILLLASFGYKLISAYSEYDSITENENEIITIARGEQQEEFYVTGAD